MTSTQEQTRGAVVASIAGEVFAQLDELSDDTYGIICDATKDEPASTFAALETFANDLRDTLRATVQRQLDDWVARNMTPSDHDAIRCTACGHDWKPETWLDGTYCPCCGEEQDR